MSAIKFGTDGWRAIIADDYTVANVKRVAEATALWMQQREVRQVVIGYDSRFGGQMFANVAATVFGAHKIKVVLGHKFVSTPMVSLGIVKTQSEFSVSLPAGRSL